MRRVLAASALAALMAVASALSAAPKTVTLDVQGLTCSLCGITVKKALGRVEGVTQAEVNYDRKEVVVTFDDAKTSVEELTKATANTGYPSRLKR